MKRKYESGIALAIEAAGGLRALARIINRQHPTITTWKKIPTEHILTIEAALNIPREKLRPDLYRK